MPILINKMFVTEMTQRKENFCNGGTDNGKEERFVEFKMLNPELL